MLNYACCKYVVTKATVYHSSLIDLSRSRSVHAVEHQPCCPDPQLLSAADCRAVHYGLCSPLLKLPSFSVAPTSPTKTAPQPPRAQSASPAAGLDLEALDPVELLAADLEGKLEALVNSFVAQDKVRLAARKSKTTAVPSAQASSSGKRSVLAQSSGVDTSSKASSSFSAKNKADVDTKLEVKKKWLATSDKEGKAKKDNGLKSALSEALDPKPSTVKQSTSSAVDYAKARFQGNAEPHRFEELLKQRPKNGHVVNDAKSRWESLTSPEQLWTGGGPSVPCAIPSEPCHEMDSPLSTSPRRLHSPDGLYMEGGAPAIPHPKLTSSQKQHIRERSLSPTERTHAHVPVRPFLTKGSVAERVLLFERCPERNLERTPAPSKSKNAVYSAWKHGSVDSQAAVQSPHEKAFVDSQTASLKRVVRSSAKATCIPRFYYPQGKPLTAAQVDGHLKKVCAAFAVFRDGRATRSNFAAIARACGIPLYWKMPLFVACGGESRGYVTSDHFTGFWKRIVSGGRDEPTWFVKILSKGTRNYLLPDDFIPMMQDVIDTHPGLTFLKEAVEFHSRYINTVIARIFYCVNRSWSGRITIPELRKSNFLQVLSLLEDEEDINQITEYFSYEHFYVIYCKFWELDKDHDLYIDRYDLSRHNEGAISMRMIERIFSGAVTRGPVQREGKMSYSEFVWFIMSEEDKRHPRSIEYWFRCMDIDGDGYLSMYELDYFYEEQLTRMEALGIETLPFGDCLCQMLDMIQPRKKDKVSLADLKRCKMTPIFFDTFFNLEKYLDHEQRDPFASQRDHDGDGLEISDWDRFAAEEYELLVAEEGNLENHDL
ncbi:protein phosphatase PP2A, putative [Ixodes scapularis]|uniref:Protein phosphatase PP2A, putative n=1 Tax=Ixodes scapularis TaxID=6945 RepID=B7PQ19_IXOSC|nr:protein phosphatase PP2A, putative [Ixodes scapularis]|eukprot:XP_002435861.1 protein phosphatase PP2A, putative [Ixodes scapularis]